MISVESQHIWRDDFGMTIRVFVSYRRSDSRHATGRLRAVLAREFGRENVFYDVDSVGFGADFRDVINTTLQGVDALIVVVGPNFELDRLRQPNDYVRMEILEALRLGKGIVPVLVDEASMPGPDQLPADLESFAYRNAAPLRADPDFDTDAARLVRDLRRSLQTGAEGDLDPAAGLAPPSGARISDPTEAVAPGSGLLGAVMGPAGRPTDGPAANPPIFIQATGLPFAQPAEPVRQQRTAVFAIVLAVLALLGATAAVILLRPQQGSSDPSSVSEASTVAETSVATSAATTSPTTTAIPSTVAAAPTPVATPVSTASPPTAVGQAELPPLVAPNSVSRSQAADFIIHYFRTAGARQYPEAWALLSTRYQQDYGDYDAFVSFWDRVEVVGPSSLDATEVAHAANAIRISAPVVFDLFSGEHSEETITVTVVRDEDGKLLLDEYSSVRTN
jgi:hypothetical protein